jgi:hypothetical protein
MLDGVNTAVVLEYAAFLGPMSCCIFWPASAIHICPRVCVRHLQGWPEPYIYTVNNRVFGIYIYTVYNRVFGISLPKILYIHCIQPCVWDFPAKNTVYTP